MRIAIYLILSLLCCLQPSRKIDINNAKIEFLFIDKDVDGTIGGLQSESKIDLVNPENSVLKGTATVDTIDTDNFLRDGHLMWKKYFHEDKYPTIELSSNKIIDQDGSFLILADLSIKGTTKEEQFTGRFANNQITIEGKINVADYGINIKKKKEENMVEIKMTFPLES